MTFDEYWNSSPDSEFTYMVKPLAKEVWIAAVQSCADIADSCEPDDHGSLSVEDIAAAIKRECLPPNDEVKNE